MDKQHFCEVFGAVYEHSPWLAEIVYDSGIDTSELDADELCQRFAYAFKSCGREKQLAVLQAHPELASQRASSLPLTASSSREQAGAGLDQCSDNEFNQFRDMNDKYMNKYSFPFIIAVKGLGRAGILKVLKERLLNDREIEFQAALEQVNRIARFRIEDILRD